MSNRAVDKYLEREHARNEGACVECGYYRNGAHHPKIRCSRTKRCGDCGNDWPCADHAPLMEVVDAVEQWLERLQDISQRGDVERASRVVRDLRGYCKLLRVEEYSR